MNILNIFTSGNKIINNLSALRRWLPSWLPSWLTKERIIIISLFLFALIIRIIYFSHTDPFTRTEDPAGHFEYIEYVAEMMSLPAADELEQSYHPPLYYVISAIFRNIFSILSSDGGAINRALQFLSFCFHTGFLIAGTLIIKRYISDNKLLFLCLAVFYFWPSSILQSARIGNDNLLHCLYSFSLLFLCKWYDDEKTLDLSLFTLCALLCIFTKVNGVVILGCFGILLLVRFFRTKGKKKFVMKVLPFVILLVFGFAGLFAIPVLDTLNKNNAVTFANRLMIFDACLDVEAKNVLFFDFRAYIDVSFVDMFDDGTGRQYFWNYLFKTALFGTFSSDDMFFRNCAAILSFLLILIVFIAITGIITLKLHEAKTRFPIFLSLFLLLLSSAFFRFLSPIPCSNDFRYISPLIISLPVFIGSAISFLQEKKLFIFSYLLYGIAAAFVVFSIIFYIPM